MRPLMELSASLDTYRPNSAALFRGISAGSKSELILNDGKQKVLKQPILHIKWHTEMENEKNINYELNISAIYNTKADWGTQYRAPTTLQNFNSNPNGLTRKQELLVRSAIKYWVERHKHVVR